MIVAIRISYSFCVVIPYSALYMYQCHGGTCCLHIPRIWRQHFIRISEGISEILTGFSWSSLVPGKYWNSSSKALFYKPEGRGFETRRGEWHFSIYLILSAVRGPGVYSAANRNENQKQKNVSWQQSAAGAYDWQPHRHLWADYLDSVGFLTSHNPIGLQGLLRGIALLPVRYELDCKYCYK
jgi:hypothetical protein